MQKDISTLTPFAMFKVPKECEIVKSKWTSILFGLISLVFVPVNPMADPAKDANSYPPIHKAKKLHPEFTDPVLGDRAAITEWAWSPQYARRFGLPVQSDGLQDGGLWLVGVKIKREQFRDWQKYGCYIVGLMDNKLPILTLPGGRYVTHPGDNWLGGIPGKPRVGSKDMEMAVKGSAEQFTYAPAQAAWHRKPASNAQRVKPESGITIPYLFYHRSYMPDLAYFELRAGCAYFRDPELFRNELRFPTQVVGNKDDAVFETSAVKFDLPDSLIQRIHPYILEAEDWTSCMMRRIGGKTWQLSIPAKKSKRFGSICEPLTDTQINR